MAEQDNVAWVFVSHSNEDLPAVRRVRNYLEDRGAAPLLFHLRSLTHADEFWPVIEREILARNFFLYCESDAAERSEWVQRERDAIARATDTSGRRIGRVRVDQGELDRTALDEFLADTRVFLSYGRADTERVRPFADALMTAGFELPPEINAGDDYRYSVTKHIREAAQNGWVLVFLSGDSLRNGWIARELVLADTYNARIIPVSLDSDILRKLPPAFEYLFVGHNFFDAATESSSAAQRLVKRLLTIESTAP